jgi:hypothetical protein
MSGVSYVPYTGILRITGLSFEPGDSVRVCVSASDKIDLCPPNNAYRCFNFRVGTILDHRFISGRVTDRETGEPIEDIDIHIYPYLGRFAPSYTSVTDDDGFFFVSVMPGAYSVAAMDPSSYYLTLFWNDQANPLEADRYLSTNLHLKPPIRILLLTRTE